VLADGKSFQQGVDAGVPGHEDLAARTLPAKVCGVQRRRREEKVGLSIDGDAEILLRPGVLSIVAAQARFDMGDSNPRHACAQSSSERARCVALHDDEFRALYCRSDGARDLTDMGVRVGLTAAAQLDDRKTGHPEGAGIEFRMLAGQNQPRNYSSAGERSCYG